MPPWVIVEWPTGTYYIAAGSRWKQLAAPDYFVLSGKGLVTHVALANGTEWTAFVHALGTPGPL